jgi:hypothetical protein
MELRRGPPVHFRRLGERLRHDGTHLVGCLVLGLERRSRNEPRVTVVLMKDLERGTEHRVGLDARCVERRQIRNAVALREDDGGIRFVHADNIGGRVR